MSELKKLREFMEKIDKEQKFEKFFLVLGAVMALTYFLMMLHYAGKF